MIETMVGLLVDSSGQWCSPHMALCGVFPIIYTYIKIINPVSTTLLLFLYLRYHYYSLYFFLSNARTIFLLRSPSSHHYLPLTPLYVPFYLGNLVQYCYHTGTSSTWWYGTSSSTLPAGTILHFPPDDNIWDFIHVDYSLMMVAVLTIITYILLYYYGSTYSTVTYCTIFTYCQYQYQQVYT